MNKLVFIFFVALLAVSAHAESSTVIAEQLRSAGKTVESLAYDQEGCLKEKSWISCERLAKHYDNTDPDMPCDSEMVTEYYKKCCDYSKNKVQLCCEKGYPKELEEKRDAACKAKDSKSCGKLAYIAHKQKDYEKSFKYAKKGCDDGKDNTSCVHLAYMYYYGQGVEKDYKKSFNLYEGLCERGIYSMCPTLSHFYTDGVGMKQDIKKGKKILEALCYDEYPEGCANLAALYESDKYGMKDDKKATELYTMACKDDPKSPSCDKIGGMSKRLEFFCTEQKNDYDCIQLADTYYRNDLEKSCIFITKLVNSDLNVPAARLLISPSKKKLQKNKNLLATKKGRRSLLPGSKLLQLRSEKSAVFLRKSLRIRIWARML